jgi:hypothetical protein
MLRTTVCVLIAVHAGLSQTPRPPGLVKGVVTSSGNAGFTVQTPSGDLYRYRTDSKTWMERERQRINAASLRPGEILEVVSDRDPDPVRYARLVHVIQPVKPRPLPVSAGGLYRLNPATPNPTEVFTGLVISRSSDRLVLRTRFDGDKTIFLQPDTQCLEGGDLVRSSALLPLTHVYVQAFRGKNLELVAEQVIWGAILEPQL